MSLRLIACIILVTVSACRARDMSKRGPQPLGSELDAQATGENAAPESEADEGVPAFFLDADKVSFIFQKPEEKEVGRGITIKIAPDAFGEVPYGETVGLALYRLNELKREAVYESEGRRRVRAKKVAAMELVYEEGREYEFPVVDMTGAFKAPLVLKIVPLPESPEGDASVFLPKAETTVRGLYVLAKEDQTPKVFDVQTLRLDAPEMLETE